LAETDVRLTAPATPRDFLKNDLREFIEWEVNEDDKVVKITVRTFDFMIKEGCETTSFAAKMVNAMKSIVPL
jgi:hypothetical protein